MSTLLRNTMEASPSMQPTKSHRTVLRPANYLPRVLAVVGCVACASVPAGSAVAVQTSVPSLVTPGQISALAKTLKHPIYWLGPRSGFNYELTVGLAGRVYVRYLPKGTQVGDKRAIFRMVGTYPVKRAKAELQGAAKRLKRPVEKIPNGIAVVGRPPTSIFLVFGAASYQLEVFSPSAKVTRAAVFATGIKAVP